ncbi:TatD family hydrolase [Polaribacter batillariae]|uniref:TatD family hydrolase n=1 Tax=Polaribacter batillariae TaxID=2808900 RepID=A0ABX7SWR3_9FLAO|nr:TatD family hydrolase [Polaribacter batillariae]QTD38705.1 TatD family hydrolase [Polaribacter batillariae]
MTFIDIHTHQKSFAENVFSIENKYPNSVDFSSPFSIGIHPWYLNKNNIEEELLFVEEQLQHKNCFAIGECGLDKITETDFKLQQEVFRKQVLLSEKHNKPLIIHCVKAFQEIIEIKKEIKPKQKWILHGFNKNVQVAKSLLKNGILLSFGAAIIKNKKLQKVVSEIPLNVLLLETDDSEIKIQEIYQKAANLKRIEVEKLQQIIKENFNFLSPRALLSIKRDFC